MTYDATEDDSSSVRPPLSGLPGPMVDREPRGRSIEAAALAGVAYSVLTVLALIRLSRFPSLDLGDEELAGERPARLFVGSESGRGFERAWLMSGQPAPPPTLRSLNSPERSDGDIRGSWYRKRYPPAFSGGHRGRRRPLFSDEALTAWFDDTEHRPRSYWASTWRRCHRSRSCGSLPSSVFLFSTSTLILGTGALPKWASYLGYLLGTILFVFPLVYEPLGIALPVWVFIVSVAILVNRLQVSS